MRHLYAYIFGGGGGLLCGSIDGYVFTTHIVQLRPPGSHRHLWEAITAGRASIACGRRQGSSYLRVDWWTPQTHRHHVVGRAAYSVRCCIAFAGNGCRPWTAHNTSDDVGFSAVTNCCRTWTCDSMSPASCCSCKATGCPAATAERRRNADDPGVCRTAPL